MAAASYSSDVLQTSYRPTPRQHKYQLKKEMKMLIPSDILHKSIFHVSEAIQNLSLEIREKIYKEFVAIKLTERKEMGWDKVHYYINETPFCEKRQSIVKVMFCGYCYFCPRNGRCYECDKNKKYHYIGSPIYNENNYDKIFQKIY